MFEVGKTYETKCEAKFDCIAVNDTHAWMKGGCNQTAYVWKQDGTSVSLPSQYDIKKKPLERWIGLVSNIASEYEQPGMVLFREVLC